MANSIKWSLREGRESDLAVLTALAEKFYTESVFPGLNGDFDTAAVQKEILAYLDLPNDKAVVVIAEIEDEVVGCLICGHVYHRLFKDKTVATEPMWYVLPRLRGSRLGLELLKVYEEWAKATGCFAVITGSISEKNDKLLKKLGYTETGREFIKVL